MHCWLGWLTLTSPEEKRNPLHQVSPHCLVADIILSRNKIVPSGWCSQGSLNRIPLTVLKLSRYWRNRSQATLRQHICLNRKKFHAPDLPPRRYSLCCCCRWYRQKLTVATFSRCLWRLEKILIDRHQGASCYGTHPAPINYNYNYLHFCELDGPILPTNILTANIPAICKTPFR